LHFEIEEPSCSTADKQMASKVPREEVANATFTTATDSTRKAGGE